MDNLIDQTVGHVSEKLKTLGKSVYLGNLYGLSLSNVKDQVKDIMSGNIFNTVNAIQDYVEHTNREKGEMESLENRTLWEQPLQMNDKPNGNLWEQPLQMNDKPDGNLWEQPLQMKEKPDGNLWEQPLQMKEKPDGNLWEQPLQMNDKPSGNLWDIDYAKNDIIKRGQ